MSNNLPPRAASKLGSLIDNVSDAGALVESTLSRVNWLSLAIGNNPEGPNVNEFQAELRRLRARQTQQQARFSALSMTATAVKTWLVGLPANTVFELVEPLTVTLTENETLEAAVDRIRDVITTTQREISKVKDAALPIAELKAQAKAHVDELARLGKPKITCSDKDRFSFKFETRGFSMKSPINEVLAWFDPERLVQRLHDEIDAMPEPQLRLSAIEKADLVTALSDTLFDAELEEENVIEQASSSGQTIPRRHNASPAAILGVKASRKAKVAA